MEENKNLPDQESNSGRVACYVDLLAEGSFYWNTYYAHNDNMETMQEYLNSYLPANCEIIEDNGTYAEVIQNGVTIGIHASGDGDFCSHKVEFGKAEIKFIKTTKECEYCGRKTENKKYCSRICQ